MPQTPRNIPLARPEELALPDGVRLRGFTEHDLGAAESLAREVQWPHRVEDWRFALGLGEGIVAVRDAQVLATGLRWRWGPRHATLGMIIVAGFMQGRRIGQHLMRALMQGLDDCTVLLHATPEGRGLYERHGFRTAGEIRQHQGLAAPAQLVALPRGERLRPLGRNDAKALVALDEKGAGMPREALLSRLLAEGETVVLARGNEAIGFSTLRRFGRGHVIGPVVAPDISRARALIGHWCSRHAGRFLRIDVDAASGLTEWLESAVELPRVGLATVMVRGARATRGFEHGAWALVSQALG